jgi:uncharacterized membrane protein
MNQDSFPVLKRPDSRLSSEIMFDEKISQGLGWFSIGLGTVELLAPYLVASTCGLPKGSARLIRLFGIREIISGIQIFSQGKRPTGAIWNRVAGDAADLAALGAALIHPKSKKARVLVSAANVAAITALDLMTAQKLARQTGKLSPTGEIRVKHVVFINAEPQEVYRQWRDFERFPSFMEHLISVKTNHDGTSNWTAKGPGNTAVSWDAEIVEDRENELISWRSLKGAIISNHGSVHFQRPTNGHGTNLLVEIEYKAPGGMLGAKAGRFLREEPLPQLKDDLRRFKQIVEIGEVVRSDGSPRGNGQLLQRPAQPEAGSLTNTSGRMQ